jgi:hypothetical protein
MNDRTRNYKSHPAWPQPKAKKGPWPKKPQRPTNSRPRCPSSESPPLSRGRRRITKPPPRSRAWRPLGRVPASFEGPSPSREAPPRSRPPSSSGTIPAPPTGALNALTCRGAPGSKVNPRHVDSLTPLGNQVPVPFDQPALCGHPRRCAGAVREGQCHSITLCHPLPYLLHVAPLERGMATDSALGQDDAMT